MNSNDWEGSKNLTCQERKELSQILKNGETIKRTNGEVYLTGIFEEPSSIYTHDYRISHGQTGRILKPL